MRSRDTGNFTILQFKGRQFRSKYVMYFYFLKVKTMTRTKRIGRTDIRPNK